MIDYTAILNKHYRNSQWVMNGDSYENLEWFSSTQKPTKEELDALWIPTQEEIFKIQCKQKASELLYETDWTTIADVADPENSPYLKNQSEFIAWRSQVRALAVNPVADPVFPPKPNEVWG